MIVDMRAKDTESRLFRWFIFFYASIGLPYLLNKLISFGLTPSCYTERKGDTPTQQFIFYELFSEFTNLIPPNILIGIYFFFVDICMTFTGVFNEYLVVLLSQLITRRFELLNGKLLTNVSQQNFLDDNSLTFSPTRTSRGDSGAITLRFTRNWLKLSVPQTTWLDSAS